VALLAALALIAGSTFAWFVIRGDSLEGELEVGVLDYTIDLKVDLNDIIFQPGDYFAPAELFDSYDQEWITDWLNLDADQEAALGSIKNTGNLNIIIKIGDGLEVTRYFKDNLADVHEKGMGRIDQMIADPAGYPGFPGAVLCQLAFPPTQKNIDAIVSDAVALFYVDASDDYYLALEVGAEVDVAFVIDLKTNAGLAVKAATPDLYLDNTYMASSVNFGDGWLATQFDQHDAWKEVFDPSLTADFTAMIDWMLADMGIPGYDFYIIEMPIK